MCLHGQAPLTLAVVLHHLCLVFILFRFLLFLLHLVVWALLKLDPLPSSYKSALQPIFPLSFLLSLRGQSGQKIKKIEDRGPRVDASKNVWHL